MNGDAPPSRHGRRTDLIVAIAATLAAVVGVLVLLWQLGVLPEREVTPPEAGEAAGGGGGQRDEGGEEASTGETDLIPPQLLTMNCSPSSTERPSAASITNAYEDDRVRFVNSGTEDMNLEFFDVLPEPPEALNPGEWHEVLLDEIGSYPYLCTFPSGIQSGTITVKG